MPLKELKAIERRDVVLEYLEKEHINAFKGYEVVHPVTGVVHRSFSIGFAPKYLKTIGEIRMGTGLEMNNNPFEDLPSILDLLIEDGYVLKEKTARTQMDEMYMITHKGSYFYNNGGYSVAEKKVLKKEKLEHWSRSIFWVPILISAASLIFTGANYYNNSHKLDDTNRRIDSLVNIKPAIQYNVDTVAGVNGEVIIDSVIKR